MCIILCYFKVSQQAWSFRIGFFFKFHITEASKSWQHFYVTINRAEAARGAEGLQPLWNAEQCGAIVSIKGRCEDVQIEYPEVANTQMSVQDERLHQAKSLYQPQQPLVLWNAS